MDEQQKKKKMKVAIIILAVLLGASIIALGGTLIYSHFVGKQPVSVIVPENIIAPETEEAKPDTDHSDSGSTDSEPYETRPSEDKTGSGTQGGSASDETTDSDSTDNSNADKFATALSLYNRNPDDNTPFKVGNMFPGDKETKYYCLKVSYKDDVVVRFHADIRDGYEKLAEVLKCRIVLLSTGETMYDGLMRDMPQSVNHKLAADKKTTSELFYEITAYLDTSVGNEYMEKDLIADFRWWVEEIGNLEPPDTGDDSVIAFWACLALGSLFMLILLSKKRRKEDGQHER